MLINILHLAKRFRSKLVMYSLEIYHLSYHILVLRQMFLRLLIMMWFVRQIEGKRVQQLFKLN